MYKISIIYYKFLINFRPQTKSTALQKSPPSQPIDKLPSNHLNSKTCNVLTVDDSSKVSVVNSKIGLDESNRSSVQIHPNVEYRKLLPKVSSPPKISAPAKPVSLSVNSLLFESYSSRTMSTENEIEKTNSASSYNEEGDTAADSISLSPKNSSSPNDKADGESVSNSVSFYESPPVLPQRPSSASNSSLSTPNISKGRRPSMVRNLGPEFDLQDKPSSPFQSSSLDQGAKTTHMAATPPVHIPTAHTTHIPTAHSTHIPTAHAKQTLDEPSPSSPLDLSGRIPRVSSIDPSLHFPHSPPKKLSSQTANSKTIDMTKVVKEFPMPTKSSTKTNASEEKEELVSKSVVSVSSVRKLDNVESVDLHVTDDSQFEGKRKRRVSVKKVADSGPANAAPNVIEGKGSTVQQMTTAVITSPILPAPEKIKNRDESTKSNLDEEKTAGSSTSKQPQLQVQEEKKLGPIASAVDPSKVFKVTAPRPTKAPISDKALASRNGANTPTSTCNASTFFSPSTISHISQSVIKENVLHCPHDSDNVTGENLVKSGNSSATSSPPGSSSKAKESETSTVPPTIVVAHSLTPTKRLPTLAPKSGTQKISVAYEPLPKISPKRKELKRKVHTILPKAFVFEVKNPSPTKMTAMGLKKKALLQRSPVKILPRLAPAPPVRMSTRYQHRKAQAVAGRTCNGLLSFYLPF